MLVLGRKAGERIRIGDSIEIMVIETRGDRVKLGFNAPGEIPIHREEVWRRVHAEGIRLELEHDSMSDSTCGAVY